MAAASCVHTTAKERGVRRLGCLVVIAVLAAGCATSKPPGSVANDQTDVWFTQHMVPYLRQTTTVVSLTRPYLTDPTLARLADKVNRTSQADIQQLQGWLDQRGLSPHIHSHQRICESPRGGRGGSLPGFDARHFGMTHNGSGAHQGCLGDELSTAVPAST
jgi:hypothetical protein